MGKRRDRGFRRLGFEPLERRELLAVVTVDPADGLRLTNPAVLGEWNGATTDGWTLSNAAGSSVAGGLLTATAQTGANPLQIVRQSIAGGPYLDYGYFDYLQTRLKLPANFNKDVTFSFGTTVKTGFAADRQFTIAAADVAKDGQFHTYRLDLGLEVWWRDTLRDLRIQPLGGTGAGETATIDYVEVGDLPGDLLTVYTTGLNMASGVTEATRQSVESKHFVFWWDPAVNPGGRTNWSTMQRNALRMMEESYQVYTKVDGFVEPFHYTADGLRHKINMTTWHGGYWMGGPYFNVDTSGLQDEGWGNPVPHEFGHVMDGQQPGNLVGGLWESHANFLRETWVNWFAPFFSADWQSTMDIGPLQWSNLHQDSQRLWYADYRIWTALQNLAWDPTYGVNGTNPLDAQLGAEIWSTGPSGMTVYDKLATLLPAGTSVQDVVASVLRLWPMLDFQTRDKLRAHLWTTANEKAEYDYLTGSLLIPEADQPGWYRVPLQRSPEKFAFMFHDLTPSSTTVTVELRGLDLIGTSEDWRWSLSEIDTNNNVVAYSSLWGPGEHTFTLTSAANRLQLIVVATPSDTSLDLNNQFNLKPLDKHIDTLNYPYEVRIVGAAPNSGAQEQIAYAKSASGRYHSNGGGWVDGTATVDATAYVGPNARVLGSAQVRGNARIEDYAVVSGTAQVKENARVSGYSWIKDNAIVQSYARVRDHALVGNGAMVRGNALIEDYAMIYDNVIEGSAIARGNAHTFGAYTIGGTAIVDYNYSSGWNMTDGVHFGHYPWGWGDFEHYYDATLRKPRGLVASYRVEETAGEVLWDEFGAQHAFLRGTPARVTDPSFQSPVLAFNGSDQYAVLERNLADFTDATYGLWVNPTGDADESVLYFGGSTGNYLKVTARDANGYAHMTLKVGATVQELVSTAAVPLGQWTHMALSFGGGAVTFYLNGQTAGTLATAFRPTDVLGPNDYKNPEAFYLGRDAAGNYFTGRMEDMRFYNVTLSPAEIQNEANRSGTKLGLFFANTPTTFDGSTTMVESGVRNGLVRTLSASINPHTSDYVGTYYEPVLDSTYEYDAAVEGTGFGLANGYFVVRLDGYGMWNTNVPVALNTWQTATLTFDGSVAKFYVNGIKRATLNYTTDPNNLAGKNYRIGWGQSGGDAATRTFFDGDMKDVVIYDRVLNDPDTYHWDTTAAIGYQGAGDTWDAANAVWSNGNGTAVVAWPGGTDKMAVFDTDTAASSWTVNVSGAQTPYSLAFGNADATSTDTYTLSGGTLGIGAGGVTAYASGVVNSAMTLSAAQTWHSKSGQTLTVNGGVNTNGKALTLSGSSLTALAGVVSGSGSLTKTGTGTLTLSGSSSYTGGTTINAGTVRLLNTAGSATGTGTTVVAAGAALRLGNANAAGSVNNAAITDNGVIEFNRSDAFTHSGVIGGAGVLRQLGPGALTLTAANTFTGDTQILGGTLTLGNALAIQNSTLDYAAANAGMLSFGSLTSATLGALQGDKDLALNNAALAAVALTVGGNNRSTTYAGDLTGGGSLVKNGSGTLTLTGNNTYTGATSIAAGTLLADSASGSSLGSGTITVQSGATLGGTTLAGRSVSVAAAGRLSPGAGGVGTLTAGALQLAAGSALHIEFDGTGNDTIAVGNLNGLSIAGGGLNLYRAGTTQTFAAAGTYTLIQHSGTIGGAGVGSLTVLNQAPGFRYAFADTGTAVTLTITTASIWSGADGGAWSNPANWSGVAVNPADSLVYAVAGSPGGASINDLAGATVPSIVFTSGAPTFTLSGNGATLNGDANGDAIRNESSSTQTIQLPITLGGSAAIDATTGAIIIGSASTITNAAGRNVTIEGTKDVTLNGTISGPGGVIKSADAGSLNIGNAAALGSGTFTINGGKLDNTSGGPLTLTTNNPETWGGNFAFTGSNALNMGTGTVTLAANSQVAVNNASTLTVGALNGAFDFTKSSNGTLSLAGTGSGTVKSVSITGGTLALDGASLTTTGGVSGINGGTLDIKSGTFTAPSFDLGHDGQVSTVVVEGTGTLKANGELLMGRNMGAASLIVKDNGIVNGAGQTLRMGRDNMSSIYVGLEDNAAATFSNVYVGYNTAYPDGYGAYGTLMVADAARLTAGSLTVADATGSNNPNPTHRLRGQVYQTGGTVAVNGNVTLGRSKYLAGDELVGAYNLAGGLLQTNQINNGTAAMPGTAVVNFHGGTLQYNGSAAQSDFLKLGANGAAYVYEGATIDDGGRTVTINQALKTPNAGSGLAAIALSTPAGAAGAYPVPPEVVITAASGDGGSGATAVANVNAAGQVVSITVTNPGTGYAVKPTVQLYYKGTLTAVAAANVSIAANAYSGGLTKTGAGALLLNAVNTYTGATIVAGGALGGTGTLAGALTVSTAGTLAPGAGGIGTLTVGGPLALAGTAAMEINKTAAASDKVQGISAVTYGGTLLVTNLAGTLAAGDAFNLFSANAYAGSFATLTLPSLSAGLAWDTSRLTIDGSIRVLNNSDPAPTVTVAAAAAPSPVVGTTVALSVLGADNGGEANLTYTWAATAVPSGAAAPVFSVNGTNAAKNATATFAKAGDYTFTATIADAYGATATSAVNVTVQQTATGIAINPASVALAAGGTQQFAAAVTDQFGAALASQPALQWTTTIGTIDAGGLLTAPISGGAGTVTAGTGALRATASVQAVVHAVVGSPVDTTLRKDQPGSNLGQTTSIKVDGDVGGGSPAQALLRFNNLFGNGVNQIPPGSTIVGATLQLQATNAGDALKFHRMLQPWQDTATWNSLAGGIQADGAEAAVAADLTTAAVTTGTRTFVVTTALQDWSIDPASNFGWAILPTANDGVDFNSAQSATPPQLIVDYIPHRSVAGRYVFYNRSGFDGGDAAANAADDTAIAPDKQPLLPGGTAAFANYTSYTRGLNGIMVDTLNLANPAGVTAADFAFRVGNRDDVASWATAPPAADVTVRTGAGTGGSDRITIVWLDNAIQDQWLQVTLRATPNTGLPGDDVFYFGNAIGDTGAGNTAQYVVVDPADEAAVRAHKTGFAPASIVNVYDFNRDRRVSASDELTARYLATTAETSLRLIAPTGAVTVLTMAAESSGEVAGAAGPAPTSIETSAATVRTVPADDHPASPARPQSFPVLHDAVLAAWPELWDCGSQRRGARRASMLLPEGLQSDRFHGLFFGNVEPPPSATETTHVR